jgi:hypothetical protein
VIAGGDAKAGMPSMIFADRAAIEMSANNAAASPAPTAGPWIALTIGFEQLMML